MKKISMIFLFLILICAQNAQAQYIDYPGGWTVMQMNDGENNTLMVHYTVTRSYSIGYEIDYWREDQWLFNGLQGAYLLSRWNQTEGRANLYLRGATGVATGDLTDHDDESRWAGYGGMSFDAENRRFYINYQNRYTEAGDFFDGFEQKGRLGFAPYVAEYGSLHTWIILQVDHRPESDDALVFTPMVRLFKGDVMVEFGVSDSEEVLLNLMIRF